MEKKQEIDIWAEIIPLLKEEDKSIFEQHKDCSAFAEYILSPDPSTALDNYSKDLARLNEKLKIFHKHKDYWIAYFKYTKAYVALPLYQAMMKQVIENYSEFDMDNYKDLRETIEFKELEKLNQYRLQKGF